MPDEETGRPPCCGNLTGVPDPTPSRVLGVDACKKGWVGVASDLRAYFAVSIDKLVAAAEAHGSLAVVGIDIPIGLPTAGPREADRVVGQVSRFGGRGRW